MQPTTLCCCYCLVFFFPLLETAWLLVSRHRRAFCWPPVARHSSFARPGERVVEILGGGKV
ncbi:Uncharacterized protein APZ42_021240 [Daphnia magna]|uniref:Uncharacterized protein n=1 Tax=Daphnia magna TaxID=35525 RepID=A0A164WUH1_9CRUS|nr:Uncharacterized protein APZ42_021240 [Daphnia magna]